MGCAYAQPKLQYLLTFIHLLKENMYLISIMLLL